MLIARQAVRLGEAGEVAVAQAVEASPFGADPEVALAVLGDRPHVIGGKPVAGGEELQVIQPKQPALRAQPQAAGPVLKDGRDLPVQRLRQW